MKPCYDHADIALYNADCREALASLPDQSVQCVVSSPPYFGLRDYGTAAWEGGDAACDHTIPSRVDAERAVATSTLFGSKDTQGHLQEPSYRDVCGKCGAVRVDSQIGLEQTPAAYVTAMVAVFREVRRVLRDDGTVFLNLGDSYSTGSGGDGTRSEKRADATELLFAPRPVTQGMAPKNLIGIPWRVAFALQEDGWYLRSDIIWAKPNPMPESVTDRPTRSHEYIFLLSKSSRYYYDADAIREPNSSPEQHAHNQRYAKPYAAYDDRAGDTGQPGNVNNIGIHARPGNEGRNKRSVWTVATQPYAEAHFATFPPKLIEPCILAGAPVGGVVLDPFAGAGTTLLVAKNLGRQAVGIELNADYCDLIEDRLRQDVLPLEVTA